MDQVGWRDGSDREREREGAALAHLALHRDGAIQKVRQSPRDGETQAGAAELARGGTVTLRERREELVELLFAEADARVHHLEHKVVDVSGLQAEAAVESDRAAAGELDRVAHEVHQDLAQAHRVGADAARQGELVPHAELNLALHSAHVHERVHLFDDLER
jgi:hypothetical protein